MRMFSGLLFSLSLVLLGCEESKKPSSIVSSAIDSIPHQEANAVNSYLKQFEEPSQFFTIDASKPTEVKGKKGTRISVDPSTLETLDGKPIGRTIEVELKELSSQQQLLRTNAQTVSDGRLLVSGGAYYINMTSDGQQLKLKQGSSLSVVFPKLTDREMALFYGQQDSSGTINWKEANATFVSKQEERSRGVTTASREVSKKSEMDAIVDYLAERDTVITEEEREQDREVEKNERVKQKFYEAAELESLGWINCDRFLEIEDKADLFVKFNPTDSVAHAGVYLLFKDINSVMQASFFRNSAKGNELKVPNLPKGYKVRLISLMIRNAQAYAFSSEVTIGKVQTLNVDFKPVSDWEFKSLVGE